MKESIHPSKEQIAQWRTLLGPAPLLSSEAPELFEDFLEKLATSLRPQDFVELMMIWHYAIDDWRVNRAIRHGTIAIERRYQEGVRQKLERARLHQVQKREETREHISNHTPADIAALSALEEKVLSTADDIDEMFKRKAAEQDYNIAFERSMAFQDQLDKLIATASRRRDDALEQLELYRVGLGARVREMAAYLIEGEVREIAAATIEASSLAPTEDGATTGDA